MKRSLEYLCIDFEHNIKHNTEKLYYFDTEPVKLIQ